MVAHKWTEGQLKQQAKNAVYRHFDAAKTRDFGPLATMHLGEDDLFSKFDYSAPLKRQDYSQAVMHEEVAYSNITDFNYKIDDLRIDLPTHEVAIATFHLETGGLFVNDYRFEGSPARTNLRATMVFLWKEEIPDKTVVNTELQPRIPTRAPGPHWVIIHEHYSSFPDEPPKPPPKQGSTLKSART